MYKIVQSIAKKKSLNQLISSMFVFNLRLSTCSVKDFSSILIGYGGLGGYSLLASGMECLIFSRRLPVWFCLSDFKRL